MCTSQVAKMTLEERTKPDGTMGRSVQLPIMLSSKSHRTATAADGVPLLSWDLVIHPYAMEWCEGSAPRKEHLVLMVSGPAPAQHLLLALARRGAVVPVVTTPPARARTCAGN
jgi:hypothetical protein